MGKKWGSTNTDAPEGAQLKGEIEVTQQWPAIMAMMACGSLAFLAISLTPILLAALVDAGRLTNAGLGRVATLETFGVAIGAIAGTRFLQRGGCRTKIVSLSLATALLNIACYHANTELALCACRGTCGICEGLILAGATLLLTYMRNPERMNGYFLGITTIPQVVVTYLLSGFAIPRFGVNVGFGVMGTIAIAVAAASAGVKDANIPKYYAAPQNVKIWGVRQVIGLLAIVIQNAAVGAGFAYIVQIGFQHDVPNSITALSMPVLNGAAFLAAMAVGWFGWRLNHLVMLTAGVVGQAALVAWMGTRQVPVAYLIGCGMFGLVWYTLLPFGLKLLISLDPTRRLGLLNTPASLVGLGLGPMVASLFVGVSDVSPAFKAATVMFIASSGLYSLTGFNPGKRLESSESKRSAGE